MILLCQLCSRSFQFGDLFFSTAIDSILVRPSGCAPRGVLQGVPCVGRGVAQSQIPSDPVEVDVVDEQLLMR